MGIPGKSLNFSGFSIDWSRNLCEHISCCVFGYMKHEVEISPQMLTWAITRAGHKVRDYSSQFPDVGKWIKKVKKPTIKQLERFAHNLHVPFGYLFLPQPPTEVSPIPFFRTNNNGPTNKVSLNVLDTILIIQDRQDWLREYLSDHETIPLPYVGKFSDQDSVLDIVGDIRNTLGLDKEWASGFSNYEEAMEFLIRQIERVGVFIFSNGVVGNNTHRPIPVDECRGFVLVDPVIPFMFINSADYRAAQFFTIVHELAHIWTGKSAGFDFKTLLPARDPIEKLCDQVAAEFLVPSDSFNRLWKTTPRMDLLAKHFKVSQIVIARRALDLRHISKTEFLRFYSERMNEFRKKREVQTGGDFYATTKKRISPTFAGYVNLAVKSDKLLYRDAYRLTGLRGDTFDKFFSQHFLVK